MHDTDWDLFVKFVGERFPNEKSKDWLVMWARRISKRDALSRADLKTRRALEKVGYSEG